MVTGDMNLSRLVVKTASETSGSVYVLNGPNQTGGITH